jgi:ABC-type amino acid transport substrate-binding protein
MPRAALAPMLAVLALAACGARSRAPVVTPRTAAAIGPVAVMPFRVGGELDPAAAFAARRDVPPVPEDVGEHIAVTLSRQLERNGVSVVDPAVVQQATPPAGAARYDPAMAMRVARAVGARLAVLGALTRYAEREGSAWGARVPATVWYQAVLVDAESGSVLARERFEHTQQPLSQNLLDLPRFVQGGGRWVTREEMLDGALGETAASLARAIRGTPPPAVP